MNYNSLVVRTRGFSLSTSRLRLVLIYGIAVFVSLFLFVSLSRRGHLSNVSIPYITGHRKTDLSLPDAPFISWPLARTCSETKWTPGVVFACNNNSGGIGNIRSFILTCVRYAIAAGATGLVLPQIETRSEDDLAHLFNGQQPFSYFFDEAHFRHSLHEACPAMIVYESFEAVPNTHDLRAEPLQPKAMGLRGGCDERDLNRHTDRFRQEFDAMVARSAAEFGLPTVSEQHPRLFQPVWGVQWEWPVAKDGPAFANTFGGLLRLRSDILELGKGIVAAMVKATESRPFAGVHLRTENDALSFWPAFETQAKEFLKTLTTKKLQAVYLATGNATEAGKLRERVEEHGLRVWTKDSLLQDQAELQKRLQSLTWDQQALVDFVVLLSCSYFLGVSPSSFSMTIAAKRHLATNDGSDGGIYTRPWPVNDIGDSRSRLVGNYAGHWDDWLMMYDALWP